MRINWFQVAIAGMQLVAAVAALHEGKALIAGLMLTYVVANLFLAVI